VSDADFDFLEHHLQPEHVEQLAWERAALERQIESEAERSVVHVPRSATHILGSNELPGRKNKAKNRAADKDTPNDAALEEELRKLVLQLTLNTHYESEGNGKELPCDDGGHAEIAKIMTTWRAYGLIRHLYPTTAAESGRTHP
jgi:hypothetical protein